MLFRSNSDRRMCYGIDLLLIEFKRCDSGSLICLIKARGGAVKQLGVTSKSEVMRAVFNRIARKCCSLISN